MPLVLSAGRSRSSGWVRGSVSTAARAGAAPSGARALSASAVLRTLLPGVVVSVPGRGRARSWAARLSRSLAWTTRARGDTACPGMGRTASDSGSEAKLGLGRDAKKNRPRDAAGKPSRDRHTRIDASRHDAWNAVHGPAYHSTNGADAGIGHWGSAIMVSDAGYADTVHVTHSHPGIGSTSGIGDGDMIHSVSPHMGHGISVTMTCGADAGIGRSVIMIMIGFRFGLKRAAGFDKPGRVTV